MPESRRQELVAAVLARFKGIRIADGYETNLGLNVSEWRTDPMQEGEKDLLNLRDTVSPILEEDTIGAHTHNLTVEVDLLSVNETPATQYRKMIADVIKAIGVDLTWGGLAEHTEPGAEELVVEQASRKVIGGLVRFTVIYSTARWTVYG